MSRTTLTLTREEAHALRCAIEPRLAILIQDVRIFARHVARPQGQAGGRATGEHLARLGRILLALEEANRMRCEDYPCCGHGPAGDGGPCPDARGRFPCLGCGKRYDPRESGSSYCARCLSDPKTFCDGPDCPGCDWCL